MHLPFLIAAGVLLSSALFADQSISVRAGYFSGQSFTKNGTRFKLEGPEFGLDIGLLTLPTNLVSIRFSPSIVYGGGLRKGGDSDGWIYRGMLTAIAKIPATGFYGTAGLGFASAKGRANTNFGTQSGGDVYLGFGWSLDSGIPLPISPKIELGYHTGQKAYSGFLISAVIKI